MFCSQIVGIYGGQKMKYITLAALLSGASIAAGVATNEDNKSYEVQLPAIEEVIFEEPLEINGYKPCNPENCYDTSDIRIERTVTDGMNVDTYTFKNPTVINVDPDIIVDQDIFSSNYQY